MNIKNDFFTKNRVKTALRVGSTVFDQTFVKSLRVRNALRVGSTVFDQTFVKSLRVRNALRVEAAICFLVNKKGVTVR